MATPPGAGGERRADRRAPAAANVHRDSKLAQARRRPRAAPRAGTSSGATSHDSSAASGARATASSAVLAGENGRRSRTVTRQRITSASRLSSVWETIVPSTTGSVSRARPSRRATISAREGSPEASRQRGRHEHADERSLHGVAAFGRPPGRRGAEDRVPGDRRGEHREAHQRESCGDQAGLGARARLASTRSTPMRCSASSASPNAPARQQQRAAPQRARRDALRGVDHRRPAPLGCGRRSAGTRGSRSAGSEPVANRKRAAARDGPPDAAAPARSCRAPRRRRVATRSARRARAPRAPCASRNCASSASATQRLRERERVARRARADRRGRRARRRGSRGCRRRRRACRRRTPR